MIINRILAVFIYIYLRILFFTCKFQVVNAHYHFRAKDMNESGSFAIAFFHQNILSGLTTQDCKTFSPLISASKDGDIASFVVKNLGYTPIRGSSSRRAAASLKEVVRAVNSGRRTAITVDGPRGPKYEVKPGILKISQLTGAPVLPATFRAIKHRSLNSWDHFRIPKFFSKIIIRYEKPFIVPRDATKEDIEQLRLQLQETLLQGEQLSSLV